MIGGIRSGLLTFCFVLGRAICCVKGKEGVAGSNNFDLCDNLLDLNAGETVLNSFRNGTVASLVVEKK